MIIQNTGATTPSEKFSARTLDRRARHAGLVERGRVAADDLGDGGAPRLDSALIERIGDRGDMEKEALLGEQGAAEDGGGDEPERHQRQTLLDEEGYPADDGDQHQHGDGAGLAAGFGFATVAVQAPVERADQTAHPGDGMAYAARKPVGITGHELDQQSQ